MTSERQLHRKTNLTEIKNLIKTYNNNDYYYFNYLIISYLCYHEVFTIKSIN